MQKIVMLIYLLSATIPGLTQVAVSGATCVTQNTEYQYLISNTDSSTQLKICVTGGIFTNGSNCLQDTAVTQVHVSWRGNPVTSGTITVTGEGVNESLDISIIGLLAAGKIDTASKMQIIDSAVIPVTIGCSSSSGGACNPVYSYQWQYSDDNLNWLDIDNATSQQLEFFTSIINSTYYRRKTVEEISGSIAYSDVAAVFINPSAKSGTAFWKEKPFEFTCFVRAGIDGSNTKSLIRPLQILL